MTSYRLHVDWLGRPFLTNQAHKMHYQQAGKIRREWRDAFTIAARHARVPKLEAVEIVTWPNYGDRRGLPDIDGTAPAVKGAIDGLVAAGVISDDCAPFIASLLYLPAQVVRGAPPGLSLELTEVSIPTTITTMSTQPRRSTR